MKKILKVILKFYLKIITKIVLAIHKPEIIVIAGSTNKVFTKNAVEKSLKELGFDVKTGPKNFNTDIGIPLSILSLKSGYNEYKKWIPIIYEAFFSIFKTKFPRYLILTYTTSDAGDMKYLLSIARPKITIITEITKKYIEGFNNINELLDEYRVLCSETSKKGLIVLNSDQKEVRNMKKYAKAKIVLFGQNKTSDFEIKEIKRTTTGEYFKISHNNNIKENVIKKFGEYHVYAFLASEIVKEFYEKNTK